MAAHEARLRDEIRRVDRLRAEAQVRDRLRPGLLGVVDEVPLGLQILLGAEDLDRVLVRADGSVGAEAEEHRAHRLRRLDVKRRVVVDARAGDVVGDPDREPPLRPLLPQFLEHPGDHPRRELLRREAIATADHARHQLALAVGMRFTQRREDVEEQRLAERAGLLRPVEHGDVPHARRERLHERLCGKRAVQPELSDTDPLAARRQVGHRLAHRVPTRAHDDDHALRVRVTAVVDEPVVATGAIAELAHRLLDHVRDAVIERVDGLARLEVDVGILRGAADERPRRREARADGGRGRAPRGRAPGRRRR